MQPAPPHPLWGLFLGLVVLLLGVPSATGILPVLPPHAGALLSILVAGATLLGAAYASAASPLRAPLAAFALGAVAAAAGARLVLTAILVFLDPRTESGLAPMLLVALGITTLLTGLLYATRTRAAAWGAAEGTPRRLLPASAHGALEAGALAAAVAFAAGALPVTGTWPAFMGDEASALAAREGGLALGGALVALGALMAVASALLLLGVPVHAARRGGSVIHGLTRVRVAILAAAAPLALALLLLVAGFALSLGATEPLVMPLAAFAGVSAALYSAVRAVGGVPKLVPAPGTPAGQQQTLSCPKCESFLTVDVLERPARYACPKCGTRGILLDA